MNTAWQRVCTAAATGMLCAAVLLPGNAAARDQAGGKPTSPSANFHPCNSQPALPMCQSGEGRRIASTRWGAPPQPVDPDALLDATSATRRTFDMASLRATSVYVQDLASGDVLLSRNEDAVRPIASITKLMTALVVVDAGLPMDEMLQISAADDGTLPSDMAPRLPTGARLSRADLLHLALMASENRAAHALARTYPGGLTAFVAAMNAKAVELGMNDTRFVEPTGLSNENVSSPRDLVRLMRAAAQQPLIRDYSTDAHYEARINGQTQMFNNTNPLTDRPDWNIQLSKTGFIRDAGECLIMLARIEGRDLAIVLLNAQGARMSRIGDAVRVRRILQSQIALL